MVDWQIIRFAFEDFVAMQSPGNSDLLTEFKFIMNSDEDLSFLDTKKVEAYTQRLGITTDSRRGEAFVNGRHCEMDDVSHSR